ncbi:hypothetical protein PAHAL_4G228500 [Panicum hallii]|uniref:Uncharacterized protein n=1 Tax=Panicum hallii TaxID=206008 RepID=A0A2T8JDQ5_9POAL|nr:hypothetical protein PAHAL_4G228500 [Panicum hallii]
MAPGRAKFPANKPQKHRPVPAEQPLHPYEVERLQQCMRNRARLKEFGIHDLVDVLSNANSIAHKKNKLNCRNRENSEDEYDPTNNDTDEEDLLDDDTPEMLIPPILLQINMVVTKKTAAMRPEAIKTRSKRVFAEPQTTRSTRSKKTTSYRDASLAPNEIFVPSSSLSHGSQVEEVGNFANVPALFDDNNHMTNELHAITPSDGHNQMGNEDVQLVENDRRDRGVNMGHGLEKMSRAMHGKLPIVIPEGGIRPVAPFAAAKFATECNIAVRNHMPVLKHWKDYKKNSALLQQFRGTLKAMFDINTNDASVQKACSAMMKNAIRQQRHRLKKQYFDPFPLHLVSKSSPIKSMTDEQWNDLVESWKRPKKMETCQKNKNNRSNVKHHHTTGSRSYPVHVENLGDKYIDHEPDALELFKECHYSKKKKV